jgi:hypothetical protein
LCNTRRSCESVARAVVAGFNSRGRESPRRAQVWWINKIVEDWGALKQASEETDPIPAVDWPLGQAMHDVAWVPFWKLPLGH